MDLRLGGTRFGASNQSDGPDDQNDVATHHSTSSSGSLQQGSNSPALNDFAENTMKELLGLYGIAESFRQGKHFIFLLPFCALYSSSYESCPHSSSLFCPKASKYSTSLYTA